MHPKCRCPAIGSIHAPGWARRCSRKKCFAVWNKSKKSSAEATKNDPGRPNILEKVLAPTHWKSPSLSYSSWNSMKKPPPKMNKLTVNTFQTSEPNQATASELIDSSNIWNVMNPLSAAPRRKNKLRTCRTSHRKGSVASQNTSPKDTKHSAETESVVVIAVLLAMFYIVLLYASGCVSVVGSLCAPHPVPFQGGSPCSQESIGQLWTGRSERTR